MPGSERDSERLGECGRLRNPSGWHYVSGMPALRTMLFDLDGTLIDSVRLILDSYHQARIVYDLPIPVLLSVAVLFSLPLIETRNLRWTGMIAALLLVTIANYAVQGVLQL